jgi:hypothetical protein
MELPLTHSGRVAPYALFGAAITFVIIIGVWCSHRILQRFRRRCRRKGCGRTDVSRISKIYLATDESVSFRAPNGRIRWFIRRVVKLTFVQCPCGWTELVKIDTDPMSVWHAKYVGRTDRQQFVEDSQLNWIAKQTIRNWWHGKFNELDPGATDTPPILTVDSPLRELFDTVTNSENPADKAKK